MACIFWKILFANGLLPIHSCGKGLKNSWSYSNVLPHENDTESNFQCNYFESSPWFSGKHNRWVRAVDRYSAINGVNYFYDLLNIYTNFGLINLPTGPNKCRCTNDKQKAIVSCTSCSTIGYISTFLKIIFDLWAMKLPLAKSICF